MRVVRRPHPTFARRPRRGRRRTGQLRQRARRRDPRRPRRRRPVPRHHRTTRLPRTARTGSRRRRTATGAGPLAATRRGRGARRAGGADLDGSRPAVLRLGMGGRRARHAGRVLVRLDVPPRHVDEPPSRLDHDGHARLDGHVGGLDVVDRGAPRWRRRDAPVLRDRRRDRGADPARQVARVAGEAPLRRRDQGPRRPRGEDGASRGRLRDRTRRRRGRHALRGPAGREDRHRRHRGRRPLGDRRVDGHRRTDAGRGRPGRRGDRRHRQHERCARGRGDPGRIRHRAGPDHPPRRDRAGQSGRRATPRRPCVSGVRARGDRHRRADPGGLARHGPRRRRGVHRRRRRAGHRLSLCARPGDADGDHGRHRTSGAARGDHQGRRGARGHSADRHDRARQDRHDHRRAACRSSR